MDILSEISMDTDFGRISAIRKFSGQPIFKAFDCAVIEQIAQKGYVYIACNVKTGLADIIVRRKNFISYDDERAIRKLLEKLQQSKVAGQSKWVVDRKFGEQSTYKDCKEILNKLFDEILPKHGFATRKEQVSLAEEMLDAIAHRKILLAEGETGTGKTLAYLIAAVIAKRSRVNDFHNLKLYPEMHYAGIAYMPIIISTSSIALQKAITTDYIPRISEILLENKIIKLPITSVIRKGREHYLCQQKLRSHIKYEETEKFRDILKDLLERAKRYENVDLSDVLGLNTHQKRAINVPKHCDKHCPYRDDCAYLHFRQEAQSGVIDIQVCNHQYLLADTMRRAEDMMPLIPNYQIVVIDEAHKLYQAAQSMYGASLSVDFIEETSESSLSLKFEQDTANLFVAKLAEKLRNVSKRLFFGLAKNSQAMDSDNYSDDIRKISVMITDQTIRGLRNLRDIASTLHDVIEYSPLNSTSKSFQSHIIRELMLLQSSANMLMRQNDLLYWAELSEHDFATGKPKIDRLCAIPSRLNEKLYDDLFGNSIPMILTSATLSTNGDFKYTKNRLGLDLVRKSNICESRKPSPFNYQTNALLYISETLPFPDNKDNDYILALANEIESLLYISCGHAAILFTSYRAMDMVWEYLEERDMPFPMFRMGRGDANAIEQFKQSKMGVLFASGSMWEGIDVPGDTLSLVIIPKLPFEVPDPIKAYEQTLYKDFDDYKNKVIMPEMLMKLRQGFGRGHRTETDTCVFALLDCRAGSKGIYREAVIDALPDCPVTDSMDGVEEYFFMNKSLEYFGLSE